jgi:hypothetical protein
MVRTRLLARVLKEGVQFWYNDTSSSTVKGGGGVRENVPLEKRYFMSISVPNSFSNTLGFVSLCRYVFFLNYDIFIQPGAGAIKLIKMSNVIFAQYK